MLFLEQSKDERVFSGEVVMMMCVVESWQGVPPSFTTMSSYTSVGNKFSLVSKFRSRSKARTILHMASAIGSLIITRPCKPTFLFKSCKNHRSTLETKPLWIRTVLHILLSRLTS